MPQRTSPQPMSHYSLQVSFEAQSPKIKNGQNNPRKLTSYLRNGPWDIGSCWERKIFYEIQQKLEM